MGGFLNLDKSGLYFAFRHEATISLLRRFPFGVEPCVVQ